MKKQTIKILITGDGGVGKTTLLHRYLDNAFIDTTTMTVGVEFHVQEIKVSNIICSLLLWDIGGQQRFRFMVDKYIEGAKGALLLFDTTSMKSFVNVDKWTQVLRRKDKNLPILLVGTKADLDEFSMVGDYYAKLTQKRFKMVDYIKTSAKLGLNVEKTFKTLAENILSRGLL
jgi:small GTP-binding protein